MLPAALMFAAVAFTMSSFLLGPLALVAAAGAAVAALTGLGVLLAAQLAALAAAAAVGTVVAAGVGSFSVGRFGEASSGGPDAASAAVDVAPLPGTAEELREEEAAKEAEKELLRAFDERMTRRELERRRVAKEE